jgi:large subunit ribosomal protein L4e
MIPIYNTKNQKTGEKALPRQFSEPIREDLIQRAVNALQKNDMQPYGSDPRAGKKASVMLSKRRRHYRGAYGRASSRVPRKVMTKRGTQFNLTAAFAPGTVKGRQAHPPKAWKDFTVKINDQERQKAIRSAIAATFSKVYVAKRNHKIPTTYPFFIANEFENLNKTKEVVTALNSLGFKQELERTQIKTIRAGQGKLRGRKYSFRTGPLLVVSKECPLSKSARNILGIDIIPVNALNAEMLAPGTHPGRVTLYTELAIDALQKDNLYFPKTMYAQPAAKKPAKIETKMTKPAKPAVKKEVKAKTEKPVITKEKAKQ